MAKLILHLKKDDLVRGLKGAHLQLYAMLQDMARDHGIVLETRARDADIKVGTRTVDDKRFEDGNLHIIDDRSVIAANVLNAGVAYFWRFWHLDEKGVKAFSSIGDLTYDPSQVPFRRAKPFYNRLRRTYVEQRKSKYAQPEEVQTFPKQAISVFFRGAYPASSGATTLSDHDMLDIVLEQAGDRPIIVKPHPKSSTVSDIEQLVVRASEDKRLIVSTANVHDILMSSSATVSINSTVALEGFLHRKPAILFGVSDFHHFASTVSEDLTFQDALSQERERRGGYAQYIAWYFLKNCLALNSETLSAEIWHRFRNAGFPEERFTDCTAK
ncbi:MAG: hypothetical protein CMN15_11770 [Roseovarius sp.]|nr:hypothetical protein [Roseovarius sp.]